MPSIQNIKFKDFENFILKQGCVFSRAKGDHFVYNKPGLLRPIVVPKYKILPEFIVTNNLRLLSKTKKDLLEFLND